MMGLKLNSDYRMLCKKSSSAKKGTEFFNQLKWNGATSHPCHLSNKLKHDEIKIKVTIYGKTIFLKSKPN